MERPSFTADARLRIVSIAESYQALTGWPLVRTDGDILDAMWSAPLAIVSHGTEHDPIFCFGNRLALTLFEMDFETFTQLPSRLSAEPLHRDERAGLLERVTRNGIIQDYAGVRISATGRRFRIEHAAVWNLRDRAGNPAGQAAAFSNWAYL